MALPSPCVTFVAVSISGTLLRLTVCNSAVSLSTATTYFLACTLQEVVVSSHWLTTYKPINHSSNGRTGGPDFGKPSPPKEYTACWLGSDTSLLRAFHHCVCNYARQKDKKRVTRHTNLIFHNHQFHCKVFSLNVFSLCNVAAAKETKWLGVCLEWQKMALLDRNETKQTIKTL